VVGKWKGTVKVLEKSVVSHITNLTIIKLRALALGGVKPAK